jgi:hypothetical protein
MRRTLERTLAAVSRGGGTVAGGEGAVERGRPGSVLERFEKRERGSKFWEVVG